MMLELETTKEQLEKAKEHLETTKEQLVKREELVRALEQKIQQMSLVKKKDAEQETQRLIGSSEVREAEELKPSEESM